MISRLFIAKLLLLLLVVTGCNNNTNGTPQLAQFFPVQKEKPIGIMLAVLTEELIRDTNGYLRVGHELIIWPYGYSVK